MDHLNPGVLIVIDDFLWYWDFYNELSLSCYTHVKAKRKNMMFVHP